LKTKLRLQSDEKPLLRSLAQYVNANFDKTPKNPLVNTGNGGENERKRTLSVRHEDEIMDHMKECPVCQKNQGRPWG